MLRTMDVFGGESASKADANVETIKKLNWGITHHVVKIPLELLPAQEQGILAGIAFKTIKGESGEYSGSSFSGANYTLIEEDGVMKYMYITNAVRDLILVDLQFSDMAQGFVTVDLSTDSSADYKERLLSMKARIIR